MKKSIRFSGGSRPWRTIWGFWKPTKSRPNERWKGITVFLIATLLAALYIQEKPLNDCQPATEVWENHGLNSYEEGRRA